MKQDLEKNAHGTTPVFIAIAKKIKKNIPKASYTRLTRVLSRLTSKSVETTQGVK